MRDRALPRPAVSFPLPPLVPALLLLAAVGLGGRMVARLLRARGYSRALAWSHGGVALLGIGLLAFAALAGSVDPLLDDGTLFLAMAASGGVVLAVLGRRGEPPIGVLVFLHALFALFGFVLVLIALARLGLGA